MASKKPTDEELSKMFEGIGDDSENTSSNTAAQGKPATTTTTSTDAEDDPLAELRNLAAHPQGASRSSTPRMSSSAASIRKNTPPSTRSGRSSEEKTDASARGVAEAEQKQQKEAAAAGGGGAAAGTWWGGLSGLSSLANAAVKQARGAVEEIQKNEDAMKWVEQARGNINYDALKGLSTSAFAVGDDLRSRALPTFTTILHTLAPPISQHERLQIHITHDLIGYPSLDSLIYQTFSRVMSQVEGGDLLVIQRGSESAQRRPSDAGYSGSRGSSGWNDGPWWRANDSKRDISAVNGLAEGTKLVRVSAETYASDFYNARGGLEEAAKQATSVLSESNPVRSSDIFLAIQAINHTTPSDLFARGSDVSEKTEGDKTVPEQAPQLDEVISFAVYLQDPVHTITFSALSQPFPQKWAGWMDAASSSSVHDGTSFVPQLPEEIVEIINSGGVDPREWISEWIEEVLSLAVGVLAQKYVARRMGVGEGGIGRGKRREEVVESGGGEAARAI